MNTTSLYIEYLQDTHQTPFMHSMHKGIANAQLSMPKWAIPVL